MSSSDGRCYGNPKRGVNGKRAAGGLLGRLETLDVAVATNCKRCDRFSDVKTRALEQRSFGNTVCIKELVCRPTRNTTASPTGFVLHVRTWFPLPSLAVFAVVAFKGTGIVHDRVKPDITSCFSIVLITVLREAYLNCGKIFGFL